MGTDTKVKLKYSVWLGCLGAYNGGFLHGYWLEFGTDQVDTILKRIRDNCPGRKKTYLCFQCEELDVMDTENMDHRTIDSGNLKQWDRVIKEAREKLPNAHELDAFIRWTGEEYPRNPDAGFIDDFQEKYIGTFSSWHEFETTGLNLDYFFDDCPKPTTKGAPPHICCQYIDEEKLRRDQVHDYTYINASYGLIPYQSEPVHVFTNH
tara:strand:- start:2673 stop:3293 length:621 start_codon:yes stop_codon:yes gene_type:complete